MKTKLVSGLMRLIRKLAEEYGAELADMLQARPLTARVCSDVVVSAMWQRLARLRPRRWAGVGLMLVTIAAIAWDHRRSLRRTDVSGQPMSSERIELLQRPLIPNSTCWSSPGGFWTAFAEPLAGLGRDPGIDHCVPSARAHRVVDALRRSRFR